MRFDSEIFPFIKNLVKVASDYLFEDGVDEHPVFDLETYFEDPSRYDNINVLMSYSDTRNSIDLQYTRSTLDFSCLYSYSISFAPRPNGDIYSAMSLELAGGVWDIIYEKECSISECPSLYNILSVLHIDIENSLQSDVVDTQLPEEHTHLDSNGNVVGIAGCCEYCCIESAW